MKAANNFGVDFRKASEETSQPPQQGFHGVEFRKASEETSKPPQQGFL